jgi:hypothetical protein
MGINLLLNSRISPVVVRIASLVLISNNQALTHSLEKDFKEEVERIISVLKDLPDNIGLVLAWEALLS